MPAHTERLRVTTTARSEMVEVTENLRAFLHSRGVEDGMLVVYCPHTTAGLTINENADPDVKRDMLMKLDRMVPKGEAGYAHAEGNSDSHVKAALVGNSVTVLVEGGRLVLGRWQGIYFCEFDGPRQREMIVKAVAFPA